MPRRENVAVRVPCGHAAPARSRGRAPRSELGSAWRLLARAAASPTANWQRRPVIHAVAVVVLLLVSIVPQKSYSQLCKLLR